MCVCVEPSGQKPTGTGRKTEADLQSDRDRAGAQTGGEACPRSEGVLGESPVLSSEVMAETPGAAERL